MDFQFLTPAKIVFGRGLISTLGSHVASFGQRPLLVYGASSLTQSGALATVRASLLAQRLNAVEYAGIHGEPTPESVDALSAFAAQQHVDCVLAVGGGSVIDSGKAVAALAVAGGRVEDYLENVGRNLKLQQPPLPLIAVPTTAGSGAEATKNAVIASRTRQYKKSFRDERLLARVVLVDPELTFSLDAQNTAWGGMDAICQLLEAYVSKKQNPLCSALAAYFIPRGLQALRQLARDPGQAEARVTMAAVSLSSGLALANGGLGAVHGFASGLGGLYDIPHGLICAMLLPGVCRINSAKAPVIYRELAQVVYANAEATITQLIADLEELNQLLCIPADFGAYGIDRVASDLIVERSQGASMSGNPVELTHAEWASFIAAYLTRI